MTSGPDELTGPGGLGGPGGPGGLGGHDGYQGPARLRIGPDVFDVQVELRGFFQPIDGRYHWYGRIAADERLSRAATRAAGVLDTGQGASPCVLSEPDLWGRFRVSGESVPPFRPAVRLAPPE